MEAERLTTTEAGWDAVAALASAGMKSGPSTSPTRTLMMVIRAMRADFGTVFI